VAQYEAALRGSDLIITLANEPVLYASSWEDYNVFSERVLWGGALQYPYRQEDTAGYDGSYELYVNSVTGVGTIDIDHASVPAAGTNIKMLYSTDTSYENWGPFNFYNEWNGTTSLGDFYMSDDINFEDWLGATHEINLYDVEFNIQTEAQLAVGNNFSISGSENFYIDDFKVFKEGHTEIDCFDLYLPWHHSDSNNYFSIDFTYLNLDWDIDPPAGLDLHMDLLTFDLEYKLYVVYNGTSGGEDTWNVTAAFSLVPAYEMDGAPIYAEHIPGRYEWGVVGRDADSVDSAGLSLVSAAFKNKQVEYGLAGEDMYDDEIANQMPWVMSKIGSGTTSANYYYSGTDYRTALKDDWCTTWPVASSNMIGVGGPLANMLAYYGNDFTDAFYGLSQFTSYAPWQNAIVPLTCWNGTKKGYTNTNTVGYAVVSTYQDINGTVLFLVWGNWGRDTYYVTKWFHEDGIFEFQSFPRCATSVVVKVTYSNTTEGYKPKTFSVVEVLGTISETTVETVKGGIHDP
jgi:hypothetical protein